MMRALIASCLRKLAQAVDPQPAPAAELTSWVWINPAISGSASTVWLNPPEFGP